VENDPASGNGRIGRVPAQPLFRPTMTGFSVSRHSWGLAWVAWVGRKRPRARTYACIRTTNQTFRNGHFICERRDER